MEYNMQEEFVRIVAIREPGKIFQKKQTVITASGKFATIDNIVIRQDDEFYIISLSNGGSMLVPTSQFIGEME